MKFFATKRKQADEADDFDLDPFRDEETAVTRAGNGASAGRSLPGDAPTGSFTPEPAAGTEAEARANRILRALGSSAGPDDRPAVASQSAPQTAQAESVQARSVQAESVQSQTPATSQTVTQTQAPASSQQTGRPLSGPSATIPLPGRQDSPEQAALYDTATGSRLSQASFQQDITKPTAPARPLTRQRSEGPAQSAAHDIVRKRATESASALLGPSASQQLSAQEQNGGTIADPAASNTAIRPRPQGVVVHKNVGTASTPAEASDKSTLVLDQVAPPQNDAANDSARSGGARHAAPGHAGQAPTGSDPNAVGLPANDRVMQEAPQQSPPPQTVKVQPSPPGQQQQDAAWSAADAPRGNDDPLLDCLVIMTAIFERPHSADALSAGLPLVDDRLTPELFVRAAGRAGLSARIVRRPLADITNLSLPAVLLLEGGKSCVLIRQEDGKASVVLPETGHGVTQINGEKLASMYAGYVIFAKPEFQFDKRSEATEIKPTKDWFWGTLKKFWRIYAQVGVAALFVNLFAIATPLFVMNVYDRVVPTKGHETLWVLVIGVSIIFAFEFALRWLRSYFTDAAGRSADVIMASMIFQQILGVKMSEKPASAGAFANQLREFETLRDFFTSATMVTMIDLPFIFLFITLIYIIGGPVALVPLLAVPIVIGAGLVIQKPLTKIVSESARESAQKHALLVESIVGLETIKSMGAEGRTQRTWERFVGETSKSGMKARSLSQLAMFITTLTTQFTTIAVVVVGVYLIFSGDLTVGALIACTILTGRAMAPLGQVAALMTRFNQSMVSLKTLDQLMQMPVERPEGTQFVHRPNLRGAIEFRNVTFAYPHQQINALENVSFNVNPGEKIGVIGKIGSGKSTIERLALGLYHPDSGSIRIDGTDIQQIDPADLRRNIGYVSQDIFLFYGSVRENIAVGAPHADDAAILQAARLSGVDNFVSKHPQGFDLNVGERGENLSGGQRQSISIARAFVRNPNILILDEPTSAMDKGSEDWFINRLREYTVNRTLFVVTQRVSLLTLVDRLLVMDGGSIVADGPRDTVLEMLARGQIKGAGE